jgi:hypothetical protein
MTTWQDRIVGVRMTVDREFNERVEASEFSRQQWGLVMTATEFEIEHADDPERARLVANTEKLPSVLPEMDRIEEQMGSMGGGSGGGGDGIVGGIKDALGLGGSGGSKDEQRSADAEELTQAYADALQQELEDTGRWDEVRELAAEESA